MMLTNIAYADVSSHYLNPLMKGADPTIERQDDGYFIRRQAMAMLY